MMSTSLQPRVGGSSWLTLYVGCALLLLGVAACQPQEAGPQRFEAEPNGIGQTDFETSADRPASAVTLYAAARILASQGRTAEYEAALQRIIREQPRWLQAYCELAKLRLDRRDLDGAFKIIEAGLKIAPDDPVLRNNLGMCWLSCGRYEDALTEFTRAASVAPDNRKYRANMAAALGLLGRYEESLNLYDQILPREAATHNLTILREVRRENQRSNTTGFDPVGLN